MEPEDADAFEDPDGCPDPDNDRDGLLDSNDRCPLDPEDTDGFEDTDGCSEPDNDKDGVLDADDACLLEPGVPEERGCPKPARVVIEQGRINILDRVEFATAKDVILEQSEPILTEVQQTLSKNPQLKVVRVEGHTDSQGRSKKNLDLSRRRARSVVRWLVEHGIEQSRLTAFGCGENVAIADNESKEGRQQNRRVEFHIVDPAPDEPREPAGCTPIPVE
jgi:outer membrane protein OmpA-like peptidoglycan-associated protein